MSRFRRPRFARSVGGFIAALAGASVASATVDVPANPAMDRLTYFELPGYCPAALKRRTPFKESFVKSIELPPDAGFREIRNAWKELRKTVWLDEFLADPILDARRLVNDADWTRSLDRTPRAPWESYGKQAIANHYAVTTFIRMNAGGRPVDASLLQMIHQIAMRELPFHGFEGRRILRRSRREKLDPYVFQSLLSAAYKRNREVSGVPHATLRGRFRWDPIDEIEHHGSSFDEAGRRYFTSEELAAHRANPWLRVDEDSIRPRPGGGFAGVVYYCPVADVARAAESEIDGKMELITKLHFGKAPPEDVVAVIAALEKNLISIHPFLDGNGRSIRALVDLIYYRIGLPPPLRPNENDLLFRNAEAVEYARREMILTINGWAARLRGKLPWEIPK